ncbi:MAG TPA: SprT family zinc-dependent metalloprotease [Gammaproteobacteria bacterium]|nr:SprT family zinc-dependent metalloprotease [Gammaproteobacteria bacterium]
MPKNLSVESGTLLLNQTIVPFVVIRSVKRKRTIGFKIDNQQGLVIQAPLRTSLKELKKMAQSQAKWILKEYAAMVHLEKTSAEKKLVTGELVPYLGKHYPLQVHGGLHRSETCCLADNQVHVRIPQGLPENKQRHWVLCRLSRWYREQAEVVVKQRLQVWVEVSGLKPSSWRITSAMRRWGSCSTENRICINWRLIFVSLELIDYVIVHELCHIAHKNHSRAFWARVEEILPDYRYREAELKQQVMHFA